MPHSIHITGIEGMPEVRTGDDLAALIADAASRQGLAMQDADILVVTQKVVSKAEGRVVRLADIEPSTLALSLGKENGRDPRHIEVVLRESKRIVRMDRGIILSETRHGFKCANAGVDASNLPESGTVALLPEAPDESAARIRKGILGRLGVDVAVIISDTFGRPWREGATNVAIGVDGLNPLKDYRGGSDAYGHPLRTTVIAIADELAAAAELVTNKTTLVPVALIRGYSFERSGQGARSLVRPPENDLFP